MPKYSSEDFPEIPKELVKEALKEALKEWLNSQFAAFGKISLGAIASVVFAGLAYFLVHWGGLGKG